MKLRRDLEEELISIAYEYDISVGELIERWIKNYLNKEQEINELKDKITEQKEEIEELKEEIFDWEQQGGK